MESCTVQLDEDTGKFITLYLFINVENTEEIRKKLISGELQCCVMKAGLVVDLFQVIVAANKAVVNEKFGKLTTRTIFTEILFNMSLSKNITQSLVKFGIDDKEKNIIVGIIHGSDNTEAMAKDSLAAIKGERVSIGRLKEITDTSVVKKIYKVDESELKVSSLVDCVVSKMNTKDFASY
ncbi:EKC/KEOPS complex subunit TPRKB [Neodiprion pinetum]|uniref:EKC/KEOPS complex subunit TPRKB-like n=1 Tax=Neodiprion lecontei TaxID=441921 RepID=A0ABM3G8W3_NEOLC|nr:EKC/KEOPS complex subunit TPRKB-like [Neodiprion pinetum]XP_046596705.1 EKC/KEOPS complex subunit TPRKB-like [Neodiprion lecontei]XP_046620825.1 EKC/KEOPS complex subunit TPRKB-like [Neodiprion virginianus]